MPMQSLQELSSPYERTWPTLLTATSTKRAQVVTMQTAATVAMMTTRVHPCILGPERCAFINYHSNLRFTHHCK